MPLVSARTIYERARAGGYAVGGFDAEHLDMVKAILEAAEETRSPVIVFLWEADIASAGQGYLEAIVKHAAAQASVPVAIFLDHGTTFQSCLQAVMNGHTGVMIDASHLSLDENIARTRQVVDVCHMLDAMVEGEIGTVRRTFEKVGDYAEETVFTDPGQVERYTRESGVDALAISIGTESGLYEAPPQLRFDLLAEIRKCTDVYLVLHGGSGTPPDQMRRAVEGGVSGFRFATEMRLAFFETVERRRRELGLENPDSRLILGPARNAAKELIKQRMEQMGCANQACTDGLCPPFCPPAEKHATMTSAHAGTPNTDVLVELLTKTLRKELSV